MGPKRSYPVSQPPLPHLYAPMCRVREDSRDIRRPRETPQRVAQQGEGGGAGAGNQSPPVAGAAPLLQG